MKRKGWLGTWLAMGVVAAAGAGLVLAQAQPGGAGGGRRGGGGAATQPGGGGGMFGMRSPNPYSQILEQIKDLTDDQKAKLKPLSDALDEELKGWQDDLQQAMRGMMQPGGDRTKAMDEVTKLMAERDDVVLLHEIKMRQVLTPEQATKWETFRLKDLANSRLGTLGLTDEQKTKLEALENDTGKKIAGLTTGKEVVGAMADFWKQVLATILTDTQVTRVFAPPARGMGAPGGGMFGGGRFGGGGAGGAGGAGGGGGRPGGAGGGGRGNRGGGGGGGAGGAGAGGAGVGGAGAGAGN